MSGTVAANIALGQAGRQPGRDRVRAGLAARTVHPGAAGRAMTPRSGAGPAAVGRGSGSGSRSPGVPAGRAAAAADERRPLDPVTAAQILDAVERLMAGRTVMLGATASRWRGGADRTSDPGRGPVLAPGFLPT